MLKVNYYSRRDNGEFRQVVINHIDQEDATFFVENDYIVSIEDMPNTFDLVMYARPRDMDEEKEVMVFVNIETESCNEAFKHLVRHCQEEFHAN